MTGAGPRGVILHASAVALAGRGVLILGPSGAGKSALALQLMALGCDLVSDDRTALAARGGVILATAPAAIRGLIEARGVGVLKAQPAAVARIVLAVDLSAVERQRLPPERSHVVLGIALPLLLRVESPHFPAAIRQFLLAGRLE